MLAPILEAGGDEKVTPRPELLSLAEPFYSCFNECSAHRIYDGMSGVAQAIPRETVTDWLNEEEVFDPAERREYRYFVTRMDTRWRVLDGRQAARRRNALPGAKPEPIEVDDPEDDGSL